MAVKHPPAETTDQQLILAINSGDDAAFEQIYHRHREWAFRMASRICGCEHHAQDVVQDVFRYFISKFPGFELRCELRTFLYPAIRNLSLSTLRGSRRLIGGDAEAAVLDQLSAPVDRYTGTDELQHLITSLSPDHREILLLRFVDGMTLPEISTLTGIPLGTAKSRLHHALTTLRNNTKIEKFAGTVNESTHLTA